MTQLEQLVDAFAAGVYVLFGFVQLDLWLRRREERGHLWVALAAAGALGVDLTGMAYRASGRDDWPALLTLNHLAVAVACVALLELAAWLARDRVGRVGRALQVLALAAAPAAALGPPWTLGVPIAATLLLVGAGARAGRSAAAGEPGARTFARGFLFLVVCLVLDVVEEVGLLQLPYGLPLLGFVVLFLASAKSLADRRDREQEELARLRRDLEERVEERTAALSAANLQLDEMSRTDWLTGLPNRRGFLAAAEAEERRSRRSGRRFSIALADLDRFKEVNDAHGHAAGDVVLQAVAATVRAALREQDLVARWGGEEMILLLPETAAEGALAAAAAVRQAVAASVMEADGEPVALRISLGVSEHRPERTLDATIAAADRALYRAKEGGRDRVVVG
ncbi:MAG TPA: diguanylate cyclase [Thermoanaerobaculia bacterium]|nr:diguanylate cyclase [Thermoanaerobaculia bacterium]